MTHEDYDQAPGFPAKVTAVRKEAGCSRLVAEFVHAREYRLIRLQQKRRAQDTWLSKPGSLEKKRAAQRAWKKARRDERQATQST